MTISKYILILLTVVFISKTKTFSQENINNYKYVIIPTKYDFLKSEDQYQLNSLTKFLFNKYGFTAFMDNEEFPEDLHNNRCLALYADVLEPKAFLKIRLQIDLKDCDDKIIMSSKQGETKEKQFEKAYNLALRDAFETFQFINYIYQPNEALILKGLSNNKNSNAKEKDEIERLKMELEALKQDQKSDDNASIKTITSIESSSDDSKSQLVKEEFGTTLFAQPIDSGFQIVDMTPKKVMILYYSGVTNTFIVKDRNAIVYKKGDQWILAENDGKDLRTEVLNMKF